MNFKAFSVWSTRKIIVTWEYPAIQVSPYRKEIYQKAWENNFPSIESLL